jgi:hypothetical protein
MSKLYFSHDLKEDEAVSYHIDSQFGEIQGFRYCQQIKANILASSSLDTHDIIIDEVEAYKILMDRAIEEKQELLEVVDSYQSTIDVGGALYDLRAGDWSIEADRFYNGDITQLNLLVLSRIEIISEERGKRERIR